MHGCSQGDLLLRQLYYGKTPDDRGPGTLATPCLIERNARPRRRLRSSFNHFILVVPKYLLDYLGVVRLDLGQSLSKLKRVEQGVESTFAADCSTVLGPHSQKVFLLVIRR